jgi:hypothetical protein
MDSSDGNLGGLLVGINTALFSIINVWHMDFSIIILLKNTNENFIWLITFVYGLVLSCQKSSFPTELNIISQLGYDSWLLRGDFNMIRHKIDKKGKIFYYPLSKRSI